MKKKFNKKKRRSELDHLLQLQEDAIDTSDIPEITDAELFRGSRGQMYRPIKKPVTMRLDADVIEWLKDQGPGYQTKANRILRAQMMKALGGQSRSLRKARIASKQPETGGQGQHVRVWSQPVRTVQTGETRARIWGGDAPNTGRTRTPSTDTPSSDTPSKVNAA